MTSLCDVIGGLFVIHYSKLRNREHLVDAWLDLYPRGQILTENKVISRESQHVALSDSLFGVSAGRLKHITLTNSLNTRFSYRASSLLSRCADYAGYAVPQIRQWIDAHYERVARSNLASDCVLRQHLRALELGSCAKGEYFLVVEDDAIPEKDFTFHLTEIMEMAKLHPEVGVVSLGTVSGLDNHRGDCLTRSLTGDASLHVDDVMTLNAYVVRRDWACAALRLIDRFGIPLGVGPDQVLVALQLAIRRPVTWCAPQLCYQGSQSGVVSSNLWA